MMLFCNSNISNSIILWHVKHNIHSICPASLYILIMHTIPQNFNVCVQNMKLYLKVTSHMHSKTQTHTKFWYGCIVLLWSVVFLQAHYSYNKAVGVKKRYCESLLLFLKFYYTLLIKIHLFFCHYYLLTNQDCYFLLVLLFFSPLIYIILILVTGTKKAICVGVRSECFCSALYTEFLLLFSVTRITFYFLINHVLLWMFRYYIALSLLYFIIYVLLTSFFLVVIIITINVISIITSINNMWLSLSQLSTSLITIFIIITTTIFIFTFIINGVINVITITSR